MHKKFVINRTKIIGGCQLGRKVVTHDSKSDLALVDFVLSTIKFNNYIHYWNFSSEDIKLTARHDFYFGSISKRCVMRINLWRHES